MAANDQAQVGARPIPMEPLVSVALFDRLRLDSYSIISTSLVYSLNYSLYQYILINLGLSENFGAIDYEGLRVRLCLS